MADPITLPMTPPRQHRRRFASFRTIGALMLREMSTTYGRSPGGYLWSILEPAAGTMLLAVAFSLFMSAPPLGTSFALYYATGMVPFTMFLNMMNVIAQSVNFSRPLLAYPSVTWVDAIIARFLLGFLTQLMVAYILFAGIIIIFDVPTILDLLTIALGLFLASLTGLAIGVLNCFLFSRLYIWQQIWSIMTRPLVLISGVLASHERLPAPWPDYLWYNPIIHFIGLIRRGFYATYEGAYISVGYVLTVCGICALLGLVFMSRYYRDLINS